MQNPKEALGQDWLKLTEEAARLKAQIEAGEGNKQTQAHCDALLRRADETFDWLHADPARLRRAIETGEV